eukprot:TRINITY_DN8045_c0_g1_i1.p2 TRINITY_DN8045_c0_g1~~TRINITY_DN8045_c0_g1_i1.p2  ORF type:complete len:110 (+),score=10.74 TRINITY_DN8045_c0_g1_i1:280-609(+)
MSSQSSSSAGNYYDPGSQNSHGWFRSKQWIYLGPIIAAPTTHICVTLYRQTPKHRRRAMIWGGILGTTTLAIANRLFLMHHSWDPDGQTVLQDRMSTPEEEKTSLPLPV